MHMEHRSHKFSARYYRYFTIGALSWITGLIVSTILCDAFKSLDLPYFHAIPAIESYTSFAANKCEANAAWKYSWLVSPFMLAWAYYMTHKEPGWNANRREVAALLVVLILGIWACFFGLYDGNSISRAGRLGLLFRDYITGIIVGTTAVWIGLFASLTSLLLIGKNYITSR